MNELARQIWNRWVAGAAHSELRARLEGWEWEYIAAAEVAASDADYERRRAFLDWKRGQIEEELSRRLVETAR